MDLFLRSVCGDDYRVVLDRVLPDAFDDAVGEGDVFFEAEMPAVQQWTFDPSGERRASQPVLNVLGTESLRRFAEASELVQAWFPQAERIRVPDAGHLMMVQTPRQWPRHSTTSSPDIRSVAWHSSDGHSSQPCTRIPSSWSTPTRSRRCRIVPEFNAEGIPRCHTGGNPRLGMGPHCQRISERRLPAGTVVRGHKNGEEGPGRPAAADAL